MEEVLAFILNTLSVVLAAMMAILWWDQLQPGIVWIMVNGKRETLHVLLKNVQAHPPMVKFNNLNHRAH